MAEERQRIKLRDGECKRGRQTHMYTQTYAQIDRLMRNSLIERQIDLSRERQEYGE